MDKPTSSICGDERHPINQYVLADKQTNQVLLFYTFHRKKGDDFRRKHRSFHVAIPIPRGLGITASGNVSNS